MGVPDVCMEFRRPMKQGDTTLRARHCKAFNLILFMYTVLCRKQKLASVCHKTRVGGDTIRVRVVVEAGARLNLRSAAATSAIAVGHRSGQFV